MLAFLLKLRSVSLDADIVHQKGFDHRDNDRYHVDHTLARIQSLELIVGKLLQRIHRCGVNEVNGDPVGNLPDKADHQGQESKHERDHYLNLFDLHVVAALKPLELYQRACEREEQN